MRTNNTVTLLALSYKVVGPLAQFLAEMEVAPLPNTDKVYRDLKTGKFVSAKIILDLFDSFNGKNKVEAEAFVDQNEDVVTDEDNKTGEVFASALSTVDVLPALPNWGAMTLAEILPKVAYHKRYAVGGVTNNETKVPLTQMKMVREGSELVEKEVMIPVRAAGDGGEYSRFDSSNGEDPETVSLNAAQKARVKLEEWQAKADAKGLPCFYIEEIDEIIHQLRGAVSETEIHPFLDGEDVAEVIFRRLYLNDWEANREVRTKKVEAMRSLLTSLPNGGLKVKNLEDIAGAYATQAVEEMDGFWSLEIANKAVYEASRSWEMDATSGQWVLLDHTVMGYILKCFARKYGKGAQFNGASLHKNTVVREGVRALMWNCICSEPKLQHPAVRGTIARYVGHMLNVLEVTEVRQDKQRRSIGIDASPAWKTIHYENVKPEKADYMWLSRWQEEEEYKRSDLSPMDAAFALADIAKVEVVKGRERAMVLVGNRARWITSNE